VLKGDFTTSKRVWISLKILDFLSREGQEKLKEGQVLRVACQSMTLSAEIAAE
jgi:hypothetical protein